MGQYKGKRETPRDDSAKLSWLPHQGEHTEKSQPEPKPEPEPQPSSQTQKLPVRPKPQTVGDPFAEEKATVGDRLSDAVDSLARFARSRGGKAAIIAICCVLAAVVGGTIAVKSWVKPPELPPVDTGSTGAEQTPATGEEQTPPPTDQEQESAPPTDDELYPDDGYGGDMPELSGARKDGFYTFLLVGTDKGDGNTDTIMVASYDIVNQKVSIMSIPRDTMINESWDIKKINSVYSRTGNSITALSNRVKKLVGFKPDFYVKVQLSIFVELVDLVGGVEFDVPQDMQYSDPYQNLNIDLKKGVQVLDGEKAMHLVRFRGYAEGDIKRVEVQQNFLKALIKECLSLKHWGKIKAYIDLAMDNVETDLDFGSVVWFAANVLGLNDAPMLNMDNVSTCTIPGNYWASAWSRAVNSNQSYVTVYANQTVKLVNEQFNPYEQNVTAGMLDIMTILDNGDIASSTGVVKDTKHNEIMAVRRGEAYYDEEGNIVYGSPDDPTEGGDPTGGDGEPSLPPDENGSGTDTGTGGDTQTGATDPGAPTDPSVPTGGEEPELPPEEPTPPQDPQGNADGSETGGETGGDSEGEQPVG